jgi:hypothetical protein
MFLICRIVVLRFIITTRTEYVLFESHGSPICGKFMTHLLRSGVTPAQIGLTPSYDVQNRYVLF